MTKKKSSKNGRRSGQYGKIKWHSNGRRKSGKKDDWDLLGWME